MGRFRVSCRSDPAMLRKAMSNQFESYQSILEFEYSLKHQRNPKYSLRAFARDIGLNPSQLSEILAKKQGLSPARAFEVAKKLGFADEKITWFCQLVESVHARSLTGKKSAKEKIKRYSNGVISKEIVKKDLSFEVKWYHFAIRRMTSLTSFQSDPKWISDRIGISENEASSALTELVNCGLLKADENGKLVSQENVHVHAPAITKEAAAQMNKDIHNKSMEARSKFGNDRRKLGVHYLSINKDQYNDLFELVKEFEDKLDYLSYKNQTHNDLISVVISVFPLIEEQNSAVAANLEKSNSGKIE